VRELVDRALSLDPRIKQFKAAEKAARDAKKKGGPTGEVDLKQKAADEKKAAEDAAIAAAEQEKQAAEDKVRFCRGVILWVVADSLFLVFFL
jgi:DnaJ family protein C protein 2